MIAATCALLTAMLISMLVGFPLIPALQGLGAKQTVSEDAPKSHGAKQGTPTMGGWMILIGWIATVLIRGMVTSFSAPMLALCALVVGFGFIGFLDDLLIARRGKNLGLRAREKLVGQFVLAGLFAGWMAGNAVPGLTTVIQLFGEHKLDLGGTYYVLATLWIVGISNAVNFTDGLDGLAGGVCAVIGIGLALTPHSVAQLAFLPVFGAAMAGACLGFLWHNGHPAKVFMGDTGSLALGAGIAGLALLGKCEVPAQLFCLVPWAALFSVMVQVIVFKIRRKKHGLDYAKAHRVFRRTPIHHHFEELGVPETRIVTRFWLTAAASTAVGVAWMLA